LILSILLLESSYSGYLVGILYGRLKNIPENPFKDVMDLIDGSIKAALHFKEIAKSKNNQKNLATKGCKEDFAIGKWLS
jgi:hypothetical protein